MSMAGLHDLPVCHRKDVTPAHDLNVLDITLNMGSAEQRLRLARSGHALKQWPIVSVCSFFSHTARMRR